MSGPWDAEGNLRPSDPRVNPYARRTTEAPEDRTFAQANQDTLADNMARFYHRLIADGVPEERAAWWTQQRIAIIQTMSMQA